MSDPKGKQSKSTPALSGLVRAIADGLTGYLTYQARTRMSPVYSEYLLYGPVLRIASSQGWRVICECKVKFGEKKGRGDYPRIDFWMTRRAGKRRQVAAIELKWISKQHVSPKRIGTALAIDDDLRKLSAIPCKKDEDAGRYVVFAGVHRLGNVARDNPTWKVLPALRLQDRKQLRLDYQVVFRAERTCYGVTVAQLVDK